MLGKFYIHVRMRDAGGLARSSACRLVSGVCVCVQKGHKHTCARGYSLTTNQHWQLFSIANPQSFGEVLLTPMGKML